MQPINCCFETVQSVYDATESSGGQLGRGNENDCWTPALVPLVCAPPMVTAMQVGLVDA